MHARVRECRQKLIGMALRPDPYDGVVSRSVAAASIVAVGLLAGLAAVEALRDERPASEPSPAVSLERVGDEVVVTRYLAPDCESFDRVDVEVEGRTATLTVLFASSRGDRDRGCLAYCPLGTEREVITLRRFTRHPERITTLVDGGAEADHCAAGVPAKDRR